MMRIRAYRGKPKYELLPVVLSEQEAPLHPDAQVHGLLSHVGALHVAPPQPDKHEQVLGPVRWNLSVPLNWLPDTACIFCFN